MGFLYVCSCSCQDVGKCLSNAAVVLGPVRISLHKFCSGGYISEGVCLKKYQYSTEGQKFHHNLAPVLVMMSGESLEISRETITSTDFYRYCAPTGQLQ